MFVMQIGRMKRKEQVEIEGYGQWKSDNKSVGQPGTDVVDEMKSKGAGIIAKIPIKNTRIGTISVKPNVAYGNVSIVHSDRDNNTETVLKDNNFLSAGAGFELSKSRSYNIEAGAAPTFSFRDGNSVSSLSGVNAHAQGSVTVYRSKIGETNVNWQLTGSVSYVSENAPLNPGSQDLGIKGTTYSAGLKIGDDEWEAYGKLAVNPISKNTGAIIGAKALLGKELPMGLDMTIQIGNPGLPLGTSTGGGSRVGIFVRF